MRRLRIIIASIGFVILVSIAIINYSSNVKTMIQQNCVDELIELTTRTAELYHIDFTEKQKMIRSIIAILETTTSKQEEKSLLNMYKNIYGFNLGIIDGSGKGIYSGQDEIDLSKHQYFRLMKGTNSGITDTCEEPDSKEPAIYIYRHYINRNGQERILFACVRISELYQVVKTPNFKGNAETFIISQYGEIILSSESEKEDSFVYKKFDLCEENKKSKRGLWHNLANHESGYQVFYEDGKKEIYAYVPIDDFKQWFAVCVVSQDMLINAASQMIYRTYFLCFFISLLFLLLILIYMFEGSLLNREKKRLENIDLITGFDNFTRFKRQTMKRWRKNTTHNESILTFDIHGFRYVNELYGYEQGDVILTEISKILAKDKSLCFSFARINADLFVCLLSSTHETTIKEWYQQIERKIRETFPQIQCSAGVYSMAAEEKKDRMFNAVLDRANLARMIGKREERPDCVFYEARIHEEEMELKYLESQQEQALKKKEFIVYFQPKIQAQDESCSCVEALVRWNNPSRGMISPGEFIPLFEKNHFITKLDRYVFETCCRKIKQWQETGGKQIRISINVSKIQIFRKDFVTYYTTMKEKYNIPDGVLELEFTESIFFDNGDYMSKIIRELQARGFLCSIDDFGKGYSTFGSLKDLPFDILKIDGEFFSKHLMAEREKVIVECIINMAKALNMKTVAEGVETQQEVEFLKKTGCDLIQGYVYSKPLPIEEFESKYLN